MLLFYKMGAVFSPFSKGLRAKHSYIENCRIVASRCQKLCLLFEKELNNLPDDEPVENFGQLIFSSIILAFNFSTTIKHIRRMLLIPFFFFDEDSDIVKKLGTALDKKLGSNSWNVLMENISVMEKHLGLA